MKIQLWEEGRLISEDTCVSVRHENGIFFVNKSHDDGVWEWDQAFTLRPGVMLNLIKEG